MKKIFSALILICLLGLPGIAQDDVIAIHEIQGNPDHPDYPDSSYEGLIVTIEGIVVGDFQDGENGFHGDINGFYVQSATTESDDNPQTSEGLYIFERRGTLLDVSVGDRVRVTGEVDEIRGITQLEATDIILIASGEALPDSTIITLPVTDRAELEFYENMLVTVQGADSPLTVNDTYDLGRYGTLQLSADGRIYQYTQRNRPTNADDFEAYRQSIAGRVILVDDGRTNENAVPVPTFNNAFFSAENTVRSGYQIDSVTGILEFRFDEWRIQPTMPITLIVDTNARPIEPPQLGGSIQIAAYNVLNYFNGNGSGAAFPTPRGADTPQEFERQRAKTLTALIQLDADIIGLMEIENDYGAGDLSAIQDLVNGMNVLADETRCGANWDYVDVATPPLNLDQLGSDAIAVGVIYCAATVTLEPDTTPAILTDDILPDLGLADLVPTFNGVNTNRVPLAATFRELATGEDVTIVVNHFKSKGGDGDGANRDSGDGVAAWNQRRRDAVTALDAWLATMPTGTDDPDIMMIGDFNAYAMEDPIQDLIALGYNNLLDTDANSFGFPLALGQAPETQGWGTLDYAFANESLASQITGATAWPINADEPIYIDYNTEFKPESIAASLYAPDAYRASDHDPIVVGLNLES